MSKRLSARDQARIAAQSAVAVGVETTERAVETERFQGAGRDQWARIPYDRIIPDETQPRTHFEDLEELADSILVLGGLEDPIRVYPEERGRWRIKDGERRYRAIRILLDRGQEQFRDVPVLIDRRPGSRREGGARLRVEQLVTSVHKAKLTPLETARTLLEIARTDTDDGEELSAARVSELTGIKPRQAERHLQVARGLRPAEMQHLLAGYPHAPLEMLIELVKWLEGPAGYRLGPDERESVVQKIAEEKPTAAGLPALLRVVAVQKRPGRPQAAKFSHGSTREGGYDVTIRIPPHRLGEASLREAEQKLSSALAEVRQLLGTRGPTSDAPD
ncbi:MAG: ParB N-terminal domain-containing protein [Gemmatimonadota bacterium]|nr:ParB N-terminal domain-containing protein [Gemmatimonadota bacterium]